MGGEWSDAIWHAGAYGAVGSNRGEILRGDDDDRAGNINDSVYTGGLYLNGSFHNGFYLDNVFQVSQHIISAITEQKSTLSTAGAGMAISVEGGWLHYVIPGLFIEPQIQYVWQTQRLDDRTDGSDTTFSPGISQLHQFRAGMRIGNIEYEDISSESQMVSFWLKPSVIQSMRSRSYSTIGMKGVQYSDVTFHPDLDGTVLSTEVGVGVKASSQSTLVFRSGYAESIKGAAAGGYYGQMNLKIRF